MKKLPGFGINVVLKYLKPEQLDEYFDRLTQLRVEWVRVEFDLYNPLPWQLYDGFLNRCKKNSIKVLSVIGGCVPGNLINLLVPGLQYPYVVDRLGKFLAFVRVCVQRYHSFIDHWEIWNEPNTKRFWIKKPDSRAYVRLLEKVSKLIRKSQPRAKILFGAIAGDDRHKIVPGQEVNFYQHAIQLGAAKHFDIANFHPYTSDCYFSFKKKKFYVSKFANLFRNVVEYADNVSDHPVWFTEFGISRKWVRLSQKDIARVYFECYRACSNMKVPLFLWVLNDFDDSNYSPFNPETQFGLLNARLKPHQTFSELVRLLSCS